MSDLDLQRTTWRSLKRSVETIYFLDEDLEKKNENRDRDASLSFLLRTNLKHYIRKTIRTTVFSYQWIILLYIYIYSVWSTRSKCEFEEKIQLLTEKILQDTTWGFDQWDQFYISVTAIQIHIGKDESTSYFFAKCKTDLLVVGATTLHTQRTNVKIFDTHFFLNSVVHDGKKLVKSLWKSYWREKSSIIFWN